MYSQRSGTARFSKKKTFLYLAGFGVLAGLAASLLTLRWYNMSLRPVQEGATQIIQLDIAPGTSAAQVAETLEDKGLVRSQAAFSWYLRLNDKASTLQAGSYSLSPSLSVEQIVAELGQGQIKTASFTILPGFRLDQLKDRFISEGFSESEVEDAFDARNYSDHPISAYKPSDASLEGYLYPETFLLDENSTATEVVTRSLDEFDKRLTSELIEGLAAQGLSVHDSVILASIIEKEVASESDKVQVSQVFLKRLRENIVLGSDVTYFYAAAVFGGQATPSLDNPYNTRIYGGLPPGPISNFSLTTLESITRPSDTNYLYFVAGDDGITRFNETLAGHERDAALYCIELCKL